MTEKEKAYSALTAVFPNKKSIVDFIRDSESRKRLQSFVDFAARHGLIDVPNIISFKAFIDKNSRPIINERPDDLTIEELINNKDEYLNIKISTRALIDNINGLLANNDLKLPQLSSAIFTRLKKQAPDTPRKRDALRGFAFWIGYKRGDMGREFHYDALKSLCPANEKKTVYKPSGVRIAFSINSRGNIIGQDIITWMKKTVRNAFNARTNLFSNGNPLKIKNYDQTTFQVDLSNTSQTAIPSAYADTLKEAITIAHQIAIQWIISGFTTYNRFFSIGIAAGNFEETNNELQAVINAKLPEDPIIRLTDYARQCVVINKIKVVMNHMPKEIELFSGEVFKVWWIIELSDMIYWDLVPGIVSESYLGKKFVNFLYLKRQLSIPGEVNPAAENDAINFFLNFPHHSMLGAEIARALICRKKFSESMEILNALLRITPYHLNSRITKMMLYKFLGVEAPNYYFSDMMFALADKEADYIAENLTHIGEDFYYEYALLKLARLSTAVKALRQHGQNVLETMDIRLAASDLIALVKQAEDIVMRGITACSPTAERIIYLFLCIQVLKCVLFENIKADGGINARLTCPGEKIKAHMVGVFISLYQQLYTLDTSDLNLAIQFITETVSHNNSTIALDIFKPTHFFITAVFYWDILPVRNVGIVKETLNMLRNTLKYTETPALKNEPVYSFASLSGQFVSADHFILQINSIIEEIENRYKKESELEKMDPATIIGPADDDLVLMTYHL